MKLKCIGGDLNGEFWEVPSNSRIGDFVRVAQNPKFKLNTFDEGLKAYRENKSPDYITIQYLSYRIAQISFKELDLKILIPEDWTERAALRFALTQ